MSKLQNVPIKLTILDWVMEIVMVVLVLLMFAFTFSYFDALPEQIPKHFGLNVYPDAYGSKTIIWVLPIIALLLAGFFRMIINFPQTYNYPVEITKNNAQFQYTLATKTLRTVGFLTILLLASLSYRMILIGMGEHQSILKFDIIGYLITIIGLSFYTWRKAKQNA